MEPTQDWHSPIIQEDVSANDALRIQVQIIDQIHDAVISTDLNGFVTSWNKGAQRMFGYSSQEAIGQHISFVYPKELHSFLQEEVIEPLLQKSEHQVEVRMLRKSGEDFFAHVSLSMLRDLEGKPIGLIGYSMDITARQKFETALQKANQRLFNILESITDAFYTLDHDWRFTYLNPRACQVLQKTSDDLLGKSIWEVYPDLVDSFVYPAYQNVVKERTPTEFENFYKPLSTWFEVRVYPSQDGLSVYFTDISDRKLAQHELEARARQQKVVADLSQLALADHSIDELMAQTVSNVGNTLQVEYCKILELLPGEKEFLLRAGVGWKDGYVGHARIDASNNSQAAYTLKTDEPVIVEDLSSESRFTGPSLLLDHRVVSGISVIIKQRGRPFGILGAHTRQKRRFTEDDINFIQSVANLLALAWERKRIEDRLAYQADILDNAYGAIVATDENFIITSWNKAAERLYGWRRDKVLGQPVREVFRQAEIPDSWFTEVQKTLAERDSLQAEYIQSHKDGTPIYIEGRTIALYNADGKLRGYISANRDVTKRKQAENALKESETRFRQLSENIQEIFWMTSADGRELIYVSPAFEKITGRSVQEIYDTQSWLQIIHPEDFEKVARASQAESLAGGYFDLTYRVLRPDGEIRWIKDRGFPVRDETGQVYRIVGIGVDITSQVQAEENLRQLSRQVVAAQENERQRISHELHDEAGQSLTALKIGLELLQSDLSDQPETVHQSIKDAMELIEKTMDNIHSIAQLLRPPELDSLGLAPVLEDLCHTFSQHTHIPVQYQGVELPDLSGSAAVCLYRLAQEALTNIVKHSQASHVQMKLECDAESLYLIVEDDGQGFDKTTIYSNSYQKPRLGLLGMQERVELFDGSLEVDARHGRGTRLTAKIPRSKIE